MPEIPGWAVTIIVAFLTAAVTSVPALLGIVRQGKQDKRNADKLKVEIAAQVQATYSEMLADLKAERVELQEENKELRDRLEALVVLEAAIDDQAKRISELTEKVEAQAVTIRKQNERIRALELENAKLTEDNAALFKKAHEKQDEIVARIIARTQE